MLSKEQERLISRIQEQERLISRIQSIMAECLSIDGDEIEGVGPASYAIARELDRLRSAPCSVPDGWRLVPVEPTAQMKFAGSEAIDDAYSDHNEDFYDEASAAYRAMLSAAPPAPEGEGWQPIETAPKNGTPILACYWGSPDQEAYPVVSCFWSRISEGWFAEESGHTVKPTHWRPLPAPPQEGK